jgi:hypothetical protein
MHRTPPYLSPIISIRSGRVLWVLQTFSIMKGAGLPVTMGSIPVTAGSSGAWTAH